MKFYQSIFLILISQNIFSQKLIVMDSETKESIIGAEVINCETLQNIDFTNIAGEAHIILSELSNKEIRIQNQGYLSKLIKPNSDSIQVIELQAMQTSMTLGSDGLRVYTAVYRNEIENLCPNELKIIKGKWQSNSKTQNGKSTLFEISFFADTVIIIQNHGGLSKSFSKYVYEIKNDTINMFEIEQYTLDTNVGFVKSHYRNRRLKSIIPLCLFKNNCRSENELDIYPQLELVSLENSDKWYDITQSELFKNSTQIETNY